ncbi:MAG TPA: MBL fold metallo-hydrolase [Candidatus Limnocylindrales bacterium]|nr:MBL fold metallo-hydrolase [Candidatus Limnocylindrales bacterium]
MAPDRLAALDPEWRAVRAASPASRRGPDHARLTFLGHSTVLIEVDDLRILTDPVLRRGFGPVRRQVRDVLPELFEELDAVFLSHGHHDHLDQPSLELIPGRPTVILPRGYGQMAPRWRLGPVEEVEPGDHLLVDRVRIEVVHAEHRGKREPFGPVGPAIGAVIRGSRSVYFPGDTDLFDGMSSLAGTLDVALLPVWGWGPTIGEGHMNPVRAAEAAAILRPRLAIPIHWGTFYPAGLRRVIPHPFDDPGHEFAAAMALVAPDIRVQVLAPGESVEIPTAPGPG